MHWVRLVVKLGLGFVALLAGCHYSPPRAMYGMPPANEDPEVVIEDFTYQPAQGLTVGDQVVFTVELSKVPEPSDGEVTVQFTGTELPPTEYYLVTLNNNGVLPDQVARDKTYTGIATLVRPCDSMPVIARYFYETHPADAITVLPEEEE